MLTKLGKYEIKAELGTGAMGVVYRAEDPRLGRPVALKTMSANVANNPDLLKRFYREAQSAGQLRHPNIVTIYDIDEADGIPFIAMEFLEGEDLDKIVSARKDIPLVKKLDIIIQTCRGLHHAHQHGIVHRDVKPGNIVLLNDGMVKVVDFGIARIGDASMTRTGMVLGTVMYMSPEQIRGQTVDPRSDIFSVGIILYELLTFQSPFAGQDVPGILFKILNEPPQPLANFISNCPAELEQIIHRILEKDREVRYQSAEDLAFDLQRVSDHLRRDMIDVYLQQGQDSLNQKNYTVAKESLQKVLQIDSSHHRAKELLQQVQTQIYTRQRTQKIDQLLRQAKDALQEEHYDDALQSLDEILRLDSAHETARQYKEMAVERRDRQEKVRRHMERAEKFSADADFQAAKSELEAILALDRNHTGASKMMEWVLKELTEQDRIHQVRQFTQQARAQLAEKNYGKALELLDRARALDPINIEIDSLTRLVRSSQDKEQRHQALDQRLAEIEEALNKEQFEQALALADKSLEEFPDEPEVLKLHAQAGRRADIHKKRRYVDEQLTAARDFFEKNQFSSALAVLERAVQTVPDDARLTSFLKTVQEAQERTAAEAIRQEAMREAKELIRARNFSAAIEVLEKALSRAGQSPELTKLLQVTREHWQETEKDERIRQVMGRAQQALLEENFEEAIHLLERSQKELGAPAISELLQTAREQRQAFHRRRNDLIKQAQDLLRAGEAKKAVGLMDAGPRAFFKDESFQKTYAACREGLDRATFIRTAAEQVEKSLAAEDLAQAEALLQHALQTYPDDPTLQGLQKRLRDDQVRLQRFQWSQLLDEAKVMVGRMQYREAIDLLTSTPWESAGTPEIATEAKALLEVARRREQETGKRRPTFRPPARPAARAAVAERPFPAAVARKVPLGLWAGVAVLLVVLVAGGAWYFLAGTGQPGTLRLTATPWAEVVSIKEAGGETLDLTGQTPLHAELPPGEYVIELKNGERTGTVTVTVEAGQVIPLNYTFPQVDINAVVDELVSKY